MTESMREEFENYAEASLMPITKAPPGLEMTYSYIQTENAWRAWQAASTQPQQWIKCSDRLPTAQDADLFGNVIFFSSAKKTFHLKSFSDSYAAQYDCWMPTNLKRPDPPKE